MLLTVLLSHVTVSVVMANAFALCLVLHEMKTPNPNIDSANFSGYHLNY